MFGRVAGRAGESPGRWRRSKRTLPASHGWYVTTREGASLGPYPTEFDADLVAALLVPKLAQAMGPAACRRIIYNFQHDDRFRRVHVDHAAASDEQRLTS